MNSSVYDVINLNLFALVDRPLYIFTVVLVVIPRNRGINATTAILSIRGPIRMVMSHVILIIANPAKK